MVGWTVTGIAAIFAVLLANLHEVRELVNICSLKWGFIFLVLSLLTGITAKQMLQGIVFSADHLLKLTEDLFSPEGIGLLSKVTLTPEQLSLELTKFYYWPMSYFVGRSAKKGATDFLLSERRFSKLFCVAMYASWVHFLFAAIGIGIITFGIH